ncbi:SusC/RagA family TonB-linked outer membrane protein [Segetibacter sp. 3557_3]|uniref:SusC/RagA family TonB-linked outer membrane protein n=1 Tax=Segetibacter sp. 3557_3 TaxID=2547429 RepID=UPI0010583CA4|nr:SusC/RagA family TonB-linked outer membrane protein [Segetibacter sp. 3557_3]TDH19965.1 SusC/RagA family TonB-linked outer membrane protein [Segetibacter sp. 3557_3]
MNTRLLRFSLFLLVLFAAFTSVAQKVFTGKVTDVGNQPLAGVTVSIKGRPAATTNTNESGQFSITGASGETLQFSSIGFLPRDIKLGEDGVVSVVMNSNPASMDEVVVIGYGSTSRRNLTTSVAKIDPKVVPQAANNSVAQLIFGRAPGTVAVQNSAEPGGNINVSIRGRGNPLVVVDGVLLPFSGLEPGSGNRTMNGNVNRGGFAGINPNDIESIEFLKDASASIYGVNAENGVMIITTKKGRGRKTSVSYDGSKSIVTNMDYFQPLNATEYMSYYNQLTLDKYLFDNKMAPFGSAAVNLTNYYSNPAIKPFTEAEINGAGEGTDWLSHVLRSGSIDNHNISISGATEKVNYYFSGGYFNQQGTVQNSGMKRYTGRMNLTFNLTSFLSLTTNVNYGRNDYMNSQAGAQTASVGPEGFGAVQAALAYPAYLPLYEPGSGRYTQFRIIGNPLSLLNIQDRSNNTSLFANFSADIKLIPRVLTARLIYGNNTENAERNFFIPSATYFDQLNRSRGGLSTSKRQNQTLEATVSYKQRLLKMVNVDALVGIGQYPSSSFGFTATGADMMDAIGTDALGTASLSSQTVSSNRNETKLRSYFARSSFDFLDRYIVALSVRYDGYSQFFPQNKYAAFPSASLGWKISNESFLKNSKAVNLLKLRASIGVTGSAGSQAYGTFSPDGNIITFNNGGVAYVPYFLTQLDNPDLQWPKTLNKNLGLDFAFFGERISGSVDVFRDDLTRLITNVNTPLLSQISTAPVNSGHRVRQGWEMGINTVNLRRGPFEWTSMINLSRTRLRWEERFQNTFLRGWQNERDLVNSYYVFKTDGIYDGIKAISDAQPTSARQPGSPVFVDRNGDKKIDTLDVFRIDPDPRFTLGFGNTFRYKGFDLAVMFYGQVGGKGTTPAIAWSTAVDFVTGGQNGVRELNEVWTTSNPTGFRPGVAYNESALGLPVGTDIGLQSTDFVRCRNITLGYTFNSGSFSRHVSNLRVYADVQNAFIITDFKYVDPEVSVASVKGGPAPYPMARTFSIGLRANF